MQPWHFLLSTRRYAPDAGIAATASSNHTNLGKIPLTPTPIATVPVNLMKSLREKISSSFFASCLLDHSQVYASYLWTKNGPPKTDLHVLPSHTLMANRLSVPISQRVWLYRSVKSGVDRYSLFDRASRVDLIRIIFSIEQV